MYDLPEPPSEYYLPRRSPPTLRATCEALLRFHWSAVHDVGDSPYDLIKDLLQLSSAPQLALLESSSPHLSASTDHLWRALCISEFVEVRKLIEDGRMRKNDEPKSWRERYDEEEKAREARMEAVLSKMRDQYSDHKAARGTVKSIDGATQEKRRKIGHYTAARPKTLFEKARSHTKAITSIYAPKRRPTQYTTPSPVTRIARPPPKPVAVAPLPSSTSRLTDNLPPREKPKPAVTVVRSLKRPAPFPPSTSPGPSNATSPGPALPSRSTIRSMAPPRTMPRLPPTALPSSRPVPRPTSFSPPPSLQPSQHVATRTLPAVVSPPPTPFPSTTVGRPAPPKSSIFMPAKRRL